MADSTTTVKRHPIRGFLYGIMFGLGLALVAIGQSWAALGTLPPFILFIVGIIIGTAWATFGPAKGPKGAGPSTPAPEPDPPTAPSPVEVVDETIESSTDDLADGNDGGAVDEMNEMC
jgi:hypothetical protein